MKKGGMPMPDRLTKPCGISREVKDGIIKNFIPVIPEHRRHFWLNLEISDSSE